MYVFLSQGTPLDYRSLCLIFCSSNRKDRKSCTTTTTLRKWGTATYLTHFYIQRIGSTGCKLYIYLDWYGWNDGLRPRLRFSFDARICGVMWNRFDMQNWVCEGNMLQQQIAEQYWCTWMSKTIGHWEPKFSDQFSPYRPFVDDDFIFVGLFLWTL